MKKDKEVKTLKMAVSKSRDLVLAAEFHGQPVKFLEKWCHHMISSSF